MSELKTFTFTLKSIEKEQVPYKNKDGTYSALVINFDGLSKAGTPYKPLIVAAAMLKTKDGQPTKLAEQLKEAKETLIGKKVAVTKDGFNLVSLSKATFSKGFSSNKSFGGGKSSSYEEGAKRGHAITNAVNIAIANNDITEDSILSNAQMILKVSERLEKGDSPAKATKETKQVANNSEPVIDDFDF